MNSKQRIHRNLTLVIGICVLVFLSGALYPPSFPNHAVMPEAIGLEPLKEVETPEPAGKADPEPVSPQEAAIVPDPLWINNGGAFTAQTKRLLAWVDEGNPLDVQIGENASHRYAFRPVQVTSDDFRISTGVENELPAQYKVYGGREFLPSGEAGHPASFAVVNGAVALAITQNGQHFLVETDPRTGELYATALQGFDTGHAPHVHGPDCAHHGAQCVISEDGLLASTTAPESIGSEEPTRIPVAMRYPGDRLQNGAILLNADEPEVSSARVDHDLYRYGPEYDNSLRDILVLWASAKSQTGDSSGLSSRAAGYFSIAARVADVYERQLGLRYLLQELILVPSDSSEDDPGDTSGGSYAYPDLEHWRWWLSTYRPQSSYGWGHAALWTVVDGSAGGVVGRAWLDSYGSSSYGQSVQERNWGWEVHTHELGHNVGSNHTSGGIMNPSLIMGNEDFYQNVENQTYTGAKEIYSYMGSTSRAYVYGPALLRHPEEIPFGIDDTLSTAVDTPVSFNPLSNDLVQVKNGAANTLSLVEVGAVYPLAAGTASLLNGQVQFTPAKGFTGQAWLTYTLAGDVGNNGAGWLHSADVVITVGGDSTVPSLSPAVSLVDDFVISDFSTEIRINPLLNDEGSGRLWAGDIHVVLGPKDTTEESYSEQAFHLVGARILSGTGTLVLERRSMSRAGSASTDHTGYLTYRPGTNEGNEALIEYTVMDASGATAVGYVSIGRSSSVSVSASTTTLVEDSGEVAAFIIRRSGNLDLSVEETVDFSIAGTATAAGLVADYAIAGHDAFDPVTGTGSVTIPVNATEAYLYAAVLEDQASEGTESVEFLITGTTGAPVSESGGSATLYIAESSSVLSEDFDSFTSDTNTWGGWTNLKNKNPSGKGGEDFFDWAIASGSTPTANTGPTGDHTSGAGKYLLAEATGNEGSYAKLQSPAFQVSGKAGLNLDFWYNLYGADMGSLSLDLYVDGSLTVPNFWSVSGQQSTGGGDWRNAILDLSPYLPASTIQFVFRADIGNGDRSDIAIDDVQLASATSGDPKAPLVLVDPVGCTIETGQSFYMSVISEAFPAPQIQWYKDGVAISGANGPSFYIASADETTLGVYEARVSNSMGETFSQPAELQSAPGDDPPGIDFILWASANNLEGEDGSKTADPDKDGIENLFEFAFGLDPNVPAGFERLPFISFHQDGGAVYLQITYVRRGGGVGLTGVDYTVDDLIYTVEISSSMNSGSWDSGSTFVEEIIDARIENDDGTQTVTVRARNPLGSGSSFMRLSVTAIGF